MTLERPVSRQGLLTTFAKFFFDLNLFMAWSSHSHTQFFIWEGEWKEIFSLPQLI